MFVTVNCLSFKQTFRKLLGMFHYRLFYQSITPQQARKKATKI